MGMRWMLIALLAGCGGSDCLTRSRSLFHAAKTGVIGPSTECDSAPVAFDVSGSLSADGQTWHVVENSQPADAVAVAGSGTCPRLFTWIEEPAAGRVVHYYFFDNSPRLDVAHMGRCMVSYSLR